MTNCLKTGSPILQWLNINPLTFLFCVGRFLGLVTDIDGITKNWKHTELYTVLAHNEVSIFDMFWIDR